MSGDGQHDRIAAAARALLVAIGEDPDRPGLADTPRRVAAFWMDFLHGDHGTIDRVFPEEGATYSGMVILRGIAVQSMCEHHMLPFFGTAVVAYLPGPKAGLIGMSKLARIVARRASGLQVQERLTEMVADDVEAITSARGVGVSIRAHHMCAGMRGIRQPGVEFVTNTLRGEMLTEPETRAEFLDAARS